MTLRPKELIHLKNQPYRQRHMPLMLIDPDAITARLDALASAGLCPRCQDIIPPLTADTRALLAEVIRLHGALHAARLESANRLAAMRAALGAAARWRI